jgi:hypothetical protein
MRSWAASTRISVLEPAGDRSLRRHWFCDIEWENNVTNCEKRKCRRPMLEATEKHGSDAQKTLYLPKLISGEWPGTMNLTEP